MDKHNTKTLATEIIRTLKKIIFALIITNILTIGAFIWFISLPADESTETTTNQTVEDIADSNINQVMEGDINGESGTN